MKKELNFSQICQILASVATLYIGKQLVFQNGETLERKLVIGVSLNCLLVEHFYASYLKGEIEAIQTPNGWSFSQSPGLDLLSFEVLDAEESENGSKFRTTEWLRGETALNKEAVLDKLEKKLATDYLEASEVLNLARKLL